MKYLFATLEQLITSAKPAEILDWTESQQLKLFSDIQSELDIINRVISVSSEQFADEQSLAGYLAGHYIAVNALRQNISLYLEELSGLTTTENFLTLENLYGQLDNGLHDLEVKLITGYRGLTLAKFTNTKSGSNHLPKDLINSLSKIPLLAAVPEFSLFIKTAPRAGFVPPMAPMELLRRFQGAFSTVGTLDNSINNLKNHFHNPSSAAASELIRIFLTWIKVLREYE